MKFLVWANGLVFAVLGVLLLVIVFTEDKTDADHPSTEAYKMARYFLRQYIRNELGADPNKFSIGGYATPAGPQTWRIVGNYQPPIGGPLNWEMRVYGPYGRDMWRNCELRIGGEIATRTGAATPGC